MRLRDIEKLVKQLVAGGGGSGGGVTYDWDAVIDPFSGDPVIELPTWEFPEYNSSNNTFNAVNFVDLSAMPEWPGPCLARINVPPLTAGHMAELYLSPPDVDFTMSVFRAETSTLSKIDQVLVPEGTRLRMTAAAGTPYFPILCLPLA